MKSWAHTVRAGLLDRAVKRPELVQVAFDNDFYVMVLV